VNRIRAFIARAHGLGLALEPRQRQRAPALVRIGPQPHRVTLARVFQTGSLATIGSTALLIRHADADWDAGPCAAIYAPFVRDSAVSFERYAPDADELARRIARISLTHPWLVAEGTPADPDDAAAIIGFAYAGPHRQRAAYRWAADVSVYVHAGQRRRGVGRALYRALLGLLLRQGLLVACAGITLPNDASVALHESLGFMPVGVYRRIGFKAGAWRDVGWWQLALAAPADREPVEPGPPARLEGS